MSSRSCCCKDIASSCECGPSFAQHLLLISSFRQNAPACANSYDDESNGHNFNRGATTLHGDIRVVHDLRQLEGLQSEEDEPLQVDYVIHLAAAISVAESMKMPDKYNRTNIQVSAYASMVVLHAHLFRWLFIPHPYHWLRIDFLITGLCQGLLLGSLPRRETRGRCFLSRRLRRPAPPRGKAGVMLQFLPQSTTEYALLTV